MNTNPMPVVVLVSGNGTNLQTLIDAAHSGHIPIEIRAVISNREQSHALTRAERANIPSVCIEHGRYAQREEFDRVLLDEVLKYQPGLVILAGFMRILTPVFVLPLSGRLINLHPSLLPKYPGLNPHKQVLAARERMHGATVHFVNTKLDSGPVIVQGQIDISHESDETVVRKRVQQEVEYRILPLCVKWYATQRLVLSGETVLLDGNPLPPCGYQYHAAQASKEPASS